jgi:DNA-binding beta-propeller fold protein YncE
LKSGDISSFGASFIRPINLTFSPDGKYILVYDGGINKIYSICVKTNKIFTLVEIPEKLSRWLINRNITFSKDGKFILIVDQQRIYKICVKSGKISIFSGTTLYQSNIALSPDGKYTFVCDSYHHCIYRKCWSSNKVKIFAGVPNVSGSQNGPKEQALFDKPTNLTFSQDGKFLIICDRRTIKYIKIKN